MKKRTITSFISSKNRSAQDTTCDFGIDYPDDGITCKDTKYIELNVVSFDVLPASPLEKPAVDSHKCDVRAVRNGQGHRHAIR